MSQPLLVLQGGAPPRVGWEFCRDQVEVIRLSLPVTLPACSASCVFFSRCSVVAGGKGTLFGRI